MASQAHRVPAPVHVSRPHRHRSVPPGRASTRFLLDRWNKRRSDDASQLISDSYRQHIDSHINDQYRSPGGARRFLMNIVQYPGCGTFQETASCIALDAPSRQFSGLCLTSIVSPGVGHITQLCTASESSRPRTRLRDAAAFAPRTAACRLPVRHAHRHGREHRGRPAV